jgi:hypothetical protein
LIEGAFAKALTLVIWLLANLLGIGGLAERVQNLFKSLRKRIDKFIDGLILKAKGVAKKLVRKGDIKEEKAASGIRGLKVETAFMMASEGHHLYVQEKNGELTVEMATRRRDYLETLVSSARNREEEGANRKKVVERLGRVLAKLKELRWIWNAAQNKDDGEKRMLIEKQLTDIGHHLRGIGVEFGIRALEDLGHASVYVIGNELKPEYHKKIRDEFYPSKYYTSTNQWFNDRLNNPPPKGVQNPDPRKSNEFLDELKPGESWPKSKATIDHKTHVVKHWNDGGGNNMRQDARAEWFNETNNLQIASKKNNSSDGAQVRKAGFVYLPVVGPNFRGPKDKE